MKNMVTNPISCSCAEISKFGFRISNLVAAAVRAAPCLFVAMASQTLHAQEASPAPGTPLDLYLLIGQSNMAGRGNVEPQDLEPHPRVLTLSKDDQWVPAIDPIHFDKKVAGVGPGRTFGIAMAGHDPSARIGLIPCAVGGTSIRKWQPGAEDEKTGTHPYDDMLKRLRIARRSGSLKGILWHQGESDGKMGMAGTYENALTVLIDRLRAECGDPRVPFVIGQLGQFEERPWSEGRTKVDAAQRQVSEHVDHTGFVSSNGLRDRGDLAHFDAASARTLGRRMAEKMIELQKPPKPNILLIITDQQFADVMSCAGSPWLKTPGMDSIAEQGVRFTRAYVNYPVCMPERYTMFTGRLPCIRRQADGDHKPVVSLGNQARKGGYETAYFGKWHIQEKTFSREDTAYTGFDLNVGGRDVESTDRAIAYLSEEKDKPFFAVVSYYNPHDICEWGRKKAGRTDRITMRNGEVDTDPSLDVCPPLPDNFAISPDEAEAVTARRGITQKGVPNAQLMAMSFSPDDWRQYRWAYHQLVELVDAQISRVVQALEAQDLTRNTVVIFTSDHGDGYGAHRWHQKSVLYEESCRVPLIISHPGGARRNETDDRLISVGIDLMATVSDIAGVDMPKGSYYGRSALPCVLDRTSTAPGHDYVVTEAEVRLSDGEEYAGRALRTPGFKYHVWSRGERREQLFDMVGDPGETTNLADHPEYAQQLQRHRDLFADWLRKTDDTYGAN